MFKKLFVAAVLIGLPALGHAAANGTIWNSVAVCDPLYPTHCVAPAADGSIPVTGAGGGGSGTSSNFAAAFPTPGTAIGFKDSTGALMAPGRVDASNNLATFLATAIPAGTNVIGHVIADTGSTTAVTGTVAVNQTQMNGVAVSAGNGTTDTGTQRVTLSSDSTGQVIARGDIAAATADSGNPLKVGAVVAISSGVSVVAGNRANLIVDTASDLIVAPRLSSVSSVDGLAASLGGRMFQQGSANALQQEVRPFLSNGSTFDIWRSAVNGTNSIGTGIAAAGLVAQFDDASQQAITENQFGNVRMAPSHALITQPYESNSNSWTYAAASGGISNSTTAVTMVVAGAAGYRNYVTSCQLSSDALGAATEVAIRDGAAGTVIWRTKIGTGGITGGEAVQFPVPLKSSTATLLEAVTLTATITGGVYINCQGYTAL